MLQVYIIHAGSGPIMLVLLTIILVIFAHKAPPKVNAWCFCIYQFMFINSTFNTCKGLHTDN